MFANFNPCTITFGDFFCIIIFSKIFIKIKQKKKKIKHIFSSNNNVRLI